MRHLKHRSQLGRTKEHRQALMSNMSAALLRHGKIQTTLAKAKALRPYVEKIITLAKDAAANPDRALHCRRLAISRVRDIDAVKILFNERASEFANRSGGYTRIYKLGTRIGDGAEMAVIQLIAAEDEGYPKKKKKAAQKPSEKKVASEEVVEAEEVVEETTESAAVVAEETEPKA